MRKTGVRIVALLIVALMVLGLFSGVFAMFAYAADEPQPRVVTGDVKLSGHSSMTVGRASSKPFSVTFNFRITDAANVKLRAGSGFVSLPDITDTQGTQYDFSIPADSSFLFESNSTLTIEPPTSSGTYKATVTNISYNGGEYRTLSMEVDAQHNGTAYTASFDVPISSTYIRGPSSSSKEEEEEKPPTSDIVVESVTVKDGAGKVLTEVNKDTPPFSVEVIYSDLGLAAVGRFHFNDAKMEAFITSAKGFKTPGGTRGTVALISDTTKYPRFRATFKNVQCDESTDEFSFRVQYDIEYYESSIKGEGKAVLYQIKKSEDEKEGSILKPNIIVEKYSYGTETIVAGSEFDLSLTVANTSKSIGVENVVMTIEPANGFVITAASNTSFFQEMPPESSVPHSVALRTMPAVDATTTSSGTDYSVTVKFAYQYLENKEYKQGDTSVKIAIPVSQLDRFEVDTITEYSQHLIVNEEGFVTVPITNKGKSPTYNISGIVRSGSGEIIAPSTYYGNLAAGKSDTIDLSFTVSAAGEFNGEAVITYEDENMKQKQLVMPFVSMVEAPMEPPPMIPPDIGSPPEAQGPGLFTVLMCVAGGLFMAVPIALYMIKRVKAKGIEDIDEDF